MAEKVVKITPFPYDDILLDIVWSGIKKAVKKINISLYYPHKSGDNMETNEKILTATAEYSFDKSFVN